MDARRTGRDVLGLLLKYGDRRVHVGGGLRALPMSRHRLQALRNSIAAAVIVHVAKVVAVLGALTDPIDEGPVIITVMRTHGGEAGRSTLARANVSSGLRGR